MPEQSSGPGWPTILGVFFVRVVFLAGTVLVVAGCVRDMILVPK